MHFLALLLLVSITFAGELGLPYLEKSALENNYLIKEKESEIRVLEASRRTIEVTRTGDMAFSFLFFPSNSYAEKITGYQYGITGRIRYPLWREKDDIRYTTENIRSVIFEKKAQLYKIKLDVLYRLRSAYTKYYSSFYLLKELGKIKSSMENLKELALKRYRYGYLLWSDIADIENRLLQLETTIADTQQEKQTAFLEIRRITGLPELNEFIPEKYRKRVEYFSIKSVEELYKTAVINRKDIELLKNAYCTLNSAYTDEGKPFPRTWISAFGGVVNDATVDSLKFIPGFGLSLDLSAPIRLSTANRYTLLERKNRALRRLFRLKLLKESVFTDINYSVAGFETQRKRYLHLKKQVKNTTEKLKILEERVKLGLIGIDTLIREKTALLTYLAGKYRAMEESYVNTYSFYFKLIRAVGTDHLENLLTYIPETGFTKKPIDVYIWNTSGVLKQKGNIDFLIDRVMMSGIGTVYFSLDGKQISLYLKPEENNLHLFLEKAYKNTLDVELLLGENRWIYPENRKKLIQIIEKANSFNGKTAYRFSAVHLDIEPHSLPEFTIKKGEVINLYLETLRQVKNISKQKVCVDISYKYADLKFKNRSLAEMVFQTADCINVMLYTTEPEKIKHYSRIYRLIADRYGKEVRISLSVEKNQPTSISFFKLPVETLQKAIKAIESSGIDRIAFQNFTDFTEYIKTQPHLKKRGKTLEEGRHIKIIKNENSFPQVILVR